MPKPIDRRSTYYFVEIKDEPILNKFDGGWVSFNSYNAQCLNLERIWIADIDFDDVISAARMEWQRNYSREDIATLSTVGYGNAEETSTVTDNLRQELVSISANTAVAGLEVGQYRLYETCGGIRVIRLDQPMEPRSRESVRNHLFCGADQRYQELCLYQNCYRARLTPKPWRGSNQPIRVTRHIGDCAITGKTEGEERKVNWGKLKPSHDLNKLIEYHDDKTQAFGSIQLIG